MCERRRMGWPGGWRRGRAVGLGLLIWVRVRGAGLDGTAVGPVGVCFSNGCVVGDVPTIHEVRGR